MAPTLATVSPRDSLAKVAQVMRDEDIGFVPVCEGNSLLGVITDRDIVVRCVAEAHEGLANELAEHLMTKAPATIQAAATLDEAGRMMAEHEVRRLPVMDGERVVGVISHGDLVQSLESEGAADQATLGVTRPE
jgi:CBS domain-containing protein